MLQTEFIKEGTVHYLAVPCETFIERGNYWDTVFASRHIPYFMRFEIRELDGRQTIYYRLQYRMVLKQVMQDLSFTLPQLKNMVRSIVGALETVENYILDAQGIIWKTDYTFIEINTGNLVFAYNRASKEYNGTLKEFLMSIIQRISRADGEAYLFMMQFYDLVTKPDTDITMLKEFVEDFSPAAGEMSSYMALENAWKTVPEPMSETFQKVTSKSTLQEDKECRKEETAPSKSAEKDNTKGVRAAFLIIVIFNVVCIGALYFDLLTYQYIWCLFVGLILLVLVTIAYLRVTKEETPDEMMQAYFETAEVEQHILKEEEKLPDETCLLVGEKQEKNSELVQENKTKELYLKHMTNQQERVKIEHSSLVIGSMREGCDYIISQIGVSRMHAKIMKKQDGIYLLDLNSRNGTYLNGELIQSGKDYKIEEGDCIAFAQSEYIVVAI